MARLSGIHQEAQKSIFGPPRRRVEPVSTEKPQNKIRRRMLGEANADVLTDRQNETKAKQSKARIADTEEAVRCVTVACKLPSGIFLQLFEFFDKQEPSPSGMRTVQESRKVGRRYYINGNRVPFATTPTCTITNIDNGFALTPNIPKDFWERWLEQNMDARTCPEWKRGKHVFGGCSCNDLVRTGLLFANEQMKSVLSEASEKQEVRSYLEPITPDKPDPRMKSIRQLGPDEAMRDRMGIEVTDPPSITRGIGNADALVGSERDPSVSRVLGQP